MKNKWFVGLWVLLIVGFVLTGCPTGGGGDGSGSGNSGSSSSSGGGGKKITIKNSTGGSHAQTLIGIKIDDADASTNNIGYIVGSSSEPAPINIGPGETYTSPEINCRFVNWETYVMHNGEVTDFVYWNVAGTGDVWEVYWDTEDEMYFARIIR